VSLTRPGDKAKANNWSGQSFR